MRREARAPRRFVGDLARSVAYVDLIAQLCEAIAVAPRAASDIEDSCACGHMPQEACVGVRHVDREGLRAEGNGVGGVPFGTGEGKRCTVFSIASSLHFKRGGYFGSALLDAIATRVVGVARFRPSRCL